MTPNLMADAVIYALSILSWQLSRNACIGNFYTDSAVSCFSNLKIHMPLASPLGDPNQIEKDEGEGVRGRREKKRGEEERERVRSCRERKEERVKVEKLK